MNTHAIEHVPDLPYAYGIEQEQLYLKIRTAKNDIKRVNVYYKDRYEVGNPFRKKEMDCLEGTSFFDYFETKLVLESNRFRYYFELEGYDQTKVFYNERGVLTKNPKDGQAFQLPYLCQGDLYHDVRWAQEGIVYQIMPERFCNGDLTNDPPQVNKWTERVTFHSFFGGDLRGIIKKLDYLVELGITMIYMTPIFLSSSNHKYNVEDYYKIDPMFGTKEEFKELVDSAHKRGIRIILDGVFNHSSDDFFAFADIKKKGMESKYIDWYYLEELPVDMEKVNYITFGNHISCMPKLRMSNPEVEQYFIEVGKFWIQEYQIDGWRLDVCDEVDHSFWKSFYKAIKRLDKDKLIIGEIMHGNPAFARGDENDGTMNYPFREAVKDFFYDGVVDAEGFMDALSTRRHSCMKSMNKQMFNLLDSHDTQRFLIDAKQDVRKLILASVFQFTYVGIPYIYYGDEVGMTGKGDPYCRKPMEWDGDKQNKQLLEHFQKLCHLRKKYKVLVDGDFQTLLKKEGFFAFKRVTEKEEMLVLINNNSTKGFSMKVPLGVYEDVYEGTTIKVRGKVELETMGYKILKKI